jgi:UDP-N-acetylglucosamine:LPS N-acetylglucosamine transferase
LDWGLGHATRSIPIIRAILEEGHFPVLASDGRALLLLKEEFPHLPAIELPSYNIKYYSSNMVINMARQLPRITYTAFAEHFAVRKIVKEHKIDLIISDNRFGCFHFKVKSCFLTHQLNLKIDSVLAAFLGNLANRFWMSWYDEKWVPDFEGEPNISGALSHPSPVKNTRYLGPLSRMKKMDIPKKYRLAIILSGPEPQRTILERILLEQAKKIKGKILLVKGKTETKERNAIDNIEIVSFLTSHDLNEAICAAEIVVSRSGYSTLMDLTALGSKALLIPTPGQTEQELLAQHFHDQGVFMMQWQHEINLESALEKMHNFKGKNMKKSQFPKELFVSKS